MTASTASEAVAWLCVGSGDGWSEDKIIRHRGSADEYASRPEQWTVTPLYGPSEIERLRAEVERLSTAGSELVEANNRHFERSRAEYERAEAAEARAAFAEAERDELKAKFAARMDHLVSIATTVDAHAVAAITAERDALKARLDGAVAVIEGFKPATQDMFSTQVCELLDCVIEAIRAREARAKEANDGTV